jgi:hypothetical protein
VTEGKPPFSELIEQKLVETEPLSAEQQKMVYEHMARREAVAYMEALDIPAEMPVLREETKRQRALEAKWDAEAAEAPPLALTDQHITALSRAIESEGYRIMVDPATGDVKLERTSGD